MINTFTTKDSFYDDVMRKHAEALQNLESIGVFKTNAELEAWTGPNRPDPQPMEIHGIYPTIFLYGSMIHYTTVVCYEPESMEEKKEGEYAT